MVALYISRLLSTRQDNDLPSVIRLGNSRSDDEDGHTTRRKLIRPILLSLILLSVVSALALYIIYDIPHYFRDVRHCLQVAGPPYLSHDLRLSSTWGTAYNSCRCKQDTNYFANKYTCWPPRNEPADSCLFVPGFEKSDWPFPGDAGTCCWEYPRSPDSFDIRRMRCNSTIEREANPNGEPIMRAELLGKTAKVSCWPSTGGVWMKTDADALDLDFLGVSRTADTPRELGIGSGNFTTEEDEFCVKLRMVGASWWRLPTAWPCQERGKWSSNMETLVEPDCRTNVLMGWPETGGVWVVEKRVMIDATKESLGSYHLATSMEERSGAIERLGGQFVADPETHNATKAIALGQTDCDWDPEYRQRCRYWEEDFFCGTDL